MTAEIESYYRVLDLYEKHGKPYLRLGQFFVNQFIKESWPGLYYMNDRDKEREMITQWLIDHQYFYSLPPLVRELDT